MKQEISLSDSDIRAALKQKLLSKHCDDPDTVIIEELGLRRGEVRVDVALVNGCVHGYEIKSDRDSLKRLSNQVDIYSKVLDQATLVVGFRHLEEATKILPKWWGVIKVNSVDQGPKFSTVRRARKNPSKQVRDLVELLWLEDAVSLLEQHRLARGFRGKPRREVWDHICDNLNIEVISNAVRDNLKARSMRLTGQ